jgi:hypothetical protein
MDKLSQRVKPDRIKKEYPAAHQNETKPMNDRAVHRKDRPEEAPSTQSFFAVPGLLFVMEFWEGSHQKIVCSGSSGLLAMSGTISHRISTKRFVSNGKRITAATVLRRSAAKSPEYNPAPQKSMVIVPRLVVAME